MSTPEHTTPDLPAPMQRNFDDAIEQARLVAECDALAEGLMRRIDHLDAELNGLRGQLHDLGVKRTAADIEVGEYMHAVHTMCERRGIPTPQLPKIEVPRPEQPPTAPRHNGGKVHLGYDMTAVEHAGPGREQPIEHLARAAVTSTQQLPDDVFDAAPQPEQDDEKSEVKA